jgi:hypothetical protein
VQLIGMHLPTFEGCNLILPLWIELGSMLKLRLIQLNLRLPDQPPQRLEELKKRGTDVFPFLCRMSHFAGCSFSLFHFEASVSFALLRKAGIIYGGEIFGAVGKGGGEDRGGV